MGFLAKLFGRHVAGSAQAPVLTATQVADAVQALLARQREDAAAKDQASWQWGSTGSVIRRATRDCERILLPLPAQHDVQAYARRVMPLVAALANQYRGDAADADGYGLGTVREIEEGLKALFEPYPDLLEEHP